MSAYVNNFSSNCSALVSFHLKMALLTDESESDDFVDEYIRKQDAKNTTYGTNYAFNTIRRFLVSVGEVRHPEKIETGKLDTLLCRFFIAAKRRDGKQFEPDCLSTIHRGLSRYLINKKYSANILTDTGFDRSRRTLAAKRKELVKQGLGNKPNATRELSPEEVNTLFENGYFGDHNAESLQRAIWWFLSLHFGYRARDEARKLCWGDVEIVNESYSERYVEWKAERGTKTRNGKENEQKRAYDPVLYPTNTSRCPVAYFEKYKSYRPVDACKSESPFFLQIDRKANLDSCTWYLSKAMGKNSIGSILSTARKRFGFAGRKVANHSVRKTGISRLLDAGVSDLFVAQHVGMKNSDSLKSYHSANKKQRMDMSRILSESTNEVTVSASPNEVTISERRENLQQSSSQSMQSMFGGATFNNCTFNFGVSAPASFPKSPKKQKRNLMRLISWSSDDDHEE